MEEGGILPAYAVATEDAGGGCFDDALIAEAAVEAAAAGPPMATDECLGRYGCEDGGGSFVGATTAPAAAAAAAADGWMAAPPMDGCVPPCPPR